MPQVRIIFKTQALAHSCLPFYVEHCVHIGAHLQEAGRVWMSDWVYLF